MNPKVALKTEHDAVDTSGTRAQLIGEQHVNGCQNLWHHQSRRRTLRQPRHDQFRTGPRQRAP